MLLATRLPQSRIRRGETRLKRCPLKKAAGREMRLDDFLKSIRIRDEQGDPDWLKEGAELAQTRTMGE